MTLEEHESDSRDDLRIYRDLLARVEKKGELCRYLIAKERCDLIFTVFAESHEADHQFWKYQPKFAEDDVQASALTHAIREIYRAIDRQFGLILELLPPEANVFILSSVGMEDDYPTTGLIEAFCRKLGYQAAPAPGPFSLNPLTLARRAIPEKWRTGLSRGLPRRTREGLLSDQFRRTTDWEKTTAFATPAAYTSLVRVNLRGREPRGVIEPGSDYMALLNRIEADLKMLIDPDTNEPAVTRVARTVRLFDCAPHAHLPDLFVEWKPGRYKQRVVHPMAEMTQDKPDFFRRSDHSERGFLAAAGPLIHGRGKFNDISILDLAPTFLHLLNENRPTRMTGKVSEKIVNA